MAVDARDLRCNYALVETSSKLDVQVNVHTKLDYSIGGTGNIYLYGNPAEIVAGHITSIGKLIEE
jgi:hypothetical protein